jgi:hypothetical protein
MTDLFSTGEDDNGKYVVLHREIEGPLDIEGPVMPREVDPYEDWQSRLEVALYAHSQGPWQIGDLLLEGEERFSRFSQALPESIKYSPESLRQYMWCCQKIVPALRRPELSFSHHVLVASMEPELINRWLALSVENNWRIADLKASINALKSPVVPPEPTSAADEGIVLGTAPQALRDAQGAVVDYCRSKEGSRWVESDTEAIADLYSAPL